MHDDELTQSELEALSSLPREARPSDLLEERTVQALRERGWIHHRGALPIPLAWSAVAAACLVFFAAGFAIGQKQGHVKPREAGIATQPTTMTGGDQPPARDSMDVTLARPDVERPSGVQHVVWF